MPKFNNKMKLSFGNRKRINTKRKNEPMKIKHYKK